MQFELRALYAFEADQLKHTRLHSLLATLPRYHASRPFNHLFCLRFRWTRDCQAVVYVYGLFGRYDEVQAYPMGSYSPPTESLNPRRWVPYRVNLNVLPAYVELLTCGVAYMYFL